MSMLRGGARIDTPTSVAHSDRSSLSEESLGLSGNHVRHNTFDVVAILSYSILHVHDDNYLTIAFVSYSFPISSYSSRILRVR